MEQDERVKQLKLKSKQTMGISNITKPSDKPKKSNTMQTKEATLSAVKKEKEDEKEAAAAKAAEAEAAKKNGEEEPAVQEVKKPRYFPPRKLPNPFDNAALE